MRIVEVNAFHYPYMGGIEHRVHHLAKRLSGKHEVTVLTGRLPGSAAAEVIDGYSVMRLPSKFINIYNPPYIKTPGLLEALDGLKPDIVDFHYRWAPTYSRAARRYPGKKIFTFHNTYGEGAGLMKAASLMNDYLWRKPLKSFTKIVCVSDFVRRDLEARGFEPGKLITVPPGIEMPPDRETRDGGYILFVGRLVGTKGIPHLLKAMKSVDSKLVVCGGGPDLKSLTRAADRLGLGGKVSFPGRVSEEEKMRLFAGCSVFVLPSLYESYGLAAAEAMSWGKPVVASDVGGLPEVVSDGGLLARPGDPNDLAAKINTLLDDDSMRIALGKKARKLALGYTWDRTAERMEELYLGA